VSEWFNDRSNVQKLLVPAASAMQTARKEYHKVQEANHFEVCRPQREDDEMYTQLIGFLNGVAGPLAQSSRSSTPSDELEQLQ
jgi:hypothetical protein